MSHPLVLPMLIQMSIPVLILFWLAYGRLTAIKKAGDLEGLIKEGGFKPKIVNRGDSFKNQFEIPVIFYALCLLFIVTNSATGVIVWAAWVFVIARIVHALVHVTNNVIFPNRFLSFFISGIALTVMLAAAILQAI